MLVVEIAVYCMLVFIAQQIHLINIKTKQLEMDFKYEGDDKSFHVLNAVSPAFTCALPFSKLLVSEIKLKVN